MGKGIDSKSKEKKMQDVFSYNVEGIGVMLEDYYVLKGMEAHDWEAVNIRIDLEMALNSNDLSADMREVLGLRFACQYNKIQISKLTGIKGSKIQALIDDAIEIIECVMNGIERTYKNKPVPSTATTLEEYRQEVREGLVNIFDVTSHVFTDILNQTAKKDKQAQEVLRQREEGAPQNIIDEIMGNIPYNVEIWNFYQTSPMVEGAMREGEFINSLQSGYDAFRDSDRHHKVSGSEDNFATYSKSLRATGKKKNKSDTNDNGDYIGTKGNVY